MLLPKPSKLATVVLRTHPTQQTTLGNGDETRRRRRSRQWASANFTTTSRWPTSQPSTTTIRRLWFDLKSMARVEEDMENCGTLYLQSPVHVLPHSHNTVIRRSPRWPPTLRHLHFHHRYHLHHLRLLGKNPQFSCFKFLKFILPF